MKAFIASLLILAGCQRQPNTNSIVLYAGNEPVAAWTNFTLYSQGANYAHFKPEGGADIWISGTYILWKDVVSVEALRMKIGPTLTNMY